MAKIFMAVQAPVAEIKLSCENAEHKKSTITVGFKRFNNDKSTELLEELNRLTEFSEKLHTPTPRPLAEEDVRLKLLPENELNDIRNFVPATSLEKLNSITDVNNFVKDNIAYLKGVSFSIEGDKGEVKELNIPDTRECKLDPKIWEDEGYSDCKEYLLDYLLNTVWRSYIVKGLYSALINKDITEDLKRKN